MAGRNKRRTNADRSYRRSGKDGWDSVRKNRESLRQEAEWEDDDEDIFREGDFDSPLYGRSSRDSSRAPRKAEENREPAPSDREYMERETYSDGYPETSSDQTSVRSGVRNNKTNKRNKRNRKNKNNYSQEPPPLIPGP